MEEDVDVSTDAVEVETVLELEPVENVDEDEVETRFEDVLSESGDTKSGDDAIAKATMPITAKMMTAEIFWPKFT